MITNQAIAVVIPSFRVTRHILGVIASIGPEVQHIYVVDDACPDASGDHVAQHCSDPRVVVLRHDKNQGVGGAVMTGYQAAIAAGAAVIVKVDGDGQMDGRLIPDFVAPILAGEADYTKGNRFFHLEQLRTMPTMRLFGNAVLSLLNKLSSGYWDVFDPTNGFTALHADAARHLPFSKISRRYFFETDMLFRLNTINAVVVDIPMDAVYGDAFTPLAGVGANRNQHPGRHRHAGRLAGADGGAAAAGFSGLRYRLGAAAPHPQADPLPHACLNWRSAIASCSPIWPAACSAR